MRTDEKLKTIYETASRMIVRGEAAWKDFLAFAARIHKYSFDNALLVYAQNPNVTTLATLPQWNRVERNVHKGARSIAVCEYENAKLTLSYLFDISSTYGKEIQIIDWQLDEATKAEVVERFNRADNLGVAAFSETVTALASRSAAEHYERCLRSIKANAQDHIFSELPEGGLEAQLISLLTDSTAYLIGKRCGLSDEEIPHEGGMSTISDFNRIPLIAALGNAVTGNAKEILIEMEHTIKSIRAERKIENERERIEAPIHGERRHPVSESASLQRGNGRPTAGQIRQNGAGIPERQSPGPLYSFENGWQSDGGDAQGTADSHRANRTADGGNAAGRSDSRHRGHVGENPPPQQREVGGGGNRGKRDRTDSEINITENEPPQDGSFVLPDDFIGKYLEPMMIGNLLYTREQFDMLREINGRAVSGEEKAAAIYEAYRSFGTPTAEVEGITVSAVATEENLVFKFGPDSKYDGAFSWKTMQELIAGFIANGTFPAESKAKAEPLTDEALWERHRSVLEEARQILVKAEYVVSDEYLLSALKELYDQQNENPTAQQIAEQTEAIIIRDSEEVEDQDFAAVVETVERADQIETEDITAEQPVFTPPKAKAAAPQRAKRDLPSRNYQRFVKLFPDIVSGKYTSMHLEAGDAFDPLEIAHKFDNRYFIEHYWMNNGDRMYDPYMEFLLDTENETLQAASFENSSMGIYQEVYAENGYYPQLQKELNSFLSTWLKNISEQGYQPVRAIEIVNDESKTVTFPVTTEETQLSMFEAPPMGQQMTLMDLEPDPEREREEYIMSLGSNTEGGKQRIYEFALTNPTGSAFATFLFKQYGIGGAPVGKYGVHRYSYDGRGIRYDLDGSDEEIKFSWAKAAGIIQRLVNEGRYLNTEIEKAAETTVETDSTETADEIDGEFRILDECVGAHHGQLDMVMTAYKGETPVGFINYSIYEDVPHINMIEVMPSQRRQGIATRLLQNLQAQYPHTEIEWGMLTEDGKALYDAVTYSFDSEDYAGVMAALDEVNRELSVYQGLIDRGFELTDKQSDEMDYYEREQNKLQNRLEELRPTHTFVRLSQEEPEAEQIAEIEAEPPYVPQNFRYSEELQLYPNGVKSKYKANIEAIKLLKAIEADRRQATPEEQIILARYVGWGGLANAFSEKAKDWKNEYHELKTLLTEEEYKAAMNSTATAYYTEPELIKSIYAALDRFGFNGGKDRRLLDPAMGTGNFFSVLPEHLNGTKLYGVEIDSITGRIARQLYPNAEVLNRGYERTDFADNSFDVVIGNIPFNSIHVYDPRYKDEHFLIHDYFFAKSLDLVKPGGIIAFITSKGTMDKNDDTVRRYIAERAEFIGAIRLPNTAFQALAGTEVTADIIFLKKRSEPIELHAYNTPEWLLTDAGRETNWIRYNSYFIEHPEMVLGEMRQSKKMYGREDGTACIAPDGYDLYAELRRAVDNLSAEFSAEADLEPEAVEIEAEDETPEYENAPPGTKNFTYVIKDGNIYFCEKNKLIPQPFTGRKAERIKGLCEIREALLDVINLQSGRYSEEELKEKQAVLNRVYDAFVKKNGAIGSYGNILAFSDDDQFPLLRSIEDEIKEPDGSKRFEKAQIFYKATIRPHTVPTHADTAEEALYISLNTRLRVDIRYMAELTGKEPTEVIKELGDKIFLNPQKYNGNYLEGWETAEEYLTGHVRDKLVYAELQASQYPDLFTRNVAALEEAQPVPLSPADIHAPIGSPWIPLEYYRQFMYETFGTPRDLQFQIIDGKEYGLITLDYMEYTTEWRIGSKHADRGSVKVEQTYGTKRRNAYEIYEDCLNQQITTIRDRVVVTGDDGKEKEKYVINPTETRIARSKQALIKEAFAAWLWKDAERKEELLQIYNNRFNTVVPRDYDGSHLVFPGMSEEMHLRPHQANFAARVIYSGTGLAAHEVGAGKTAALIAAGMYLKNLGAIKKPVYVVPNPLVGQWATEFYRFFPNANLLVSSEEDFSAKNRNRYVSRIAMGDYDAIILAHSHFERIPISAERQIEMLDKQIREISHAIARIKAEKGENWTVKQMVMFQQNMEERLQRLSAQEKKDDLLSFEQLGVDFMFVDEAHKYKNCYVYTKMSRVAGINTSSSQRAFDMLNKCQYLQETNNGRGVVFATGTPVSNSMSEMFVMMRYLEPEELRRQGIADFDSWAATYGEIVSSLEITPEGGGYRMRQRFAKFHNLPELMRTYRLVADVQTAEMLNLPRPEIFGGKKEVISTEATAYQRLIMKRFVERAEAIRAGLVKPYEDNMLKLTGEARQMAIDPRLIDQEAPNDPTSKLNLCIDRIYDHWKETAADRLTQLVFCDVSTPSTKRVVEMTEAEGGVYVPVPNQFTNVYEEIKKVLMKRGVPEHEIAFIHDAKSEAQRQAIFEKTRRGEIRVLIGSTEKLGTGVNVQDRVIALHHLDVPWKPSDITQRDGRGLRQGNMNKAIHIYHYITEGTFDAYLWQIQEQKLRFITQVTTAKSIARSCEDIDETVLTAAQFKAVATDNPKLLIKMDLENRVSELRILQRNHQEEQAALERKIETGPGSIQMLRSKVEAITADLELMQATEGQGFSITLDGKVYTERVKAGQIMMALAGRVKNTKGFTWFDIGEYRGFSLKAGNEQYSTSTWIYLVGKDRYSFAMGDSEVGNITRLENLAESIRSDLSYAQKDLSEAERQLEIAGEQFGLPFPYEAELAQKSAELEEVNTELELGKGEDETIVDETEETDAEVGNGVLVAVAVGEEV